MAGLRNRGLKVRARPGVFRCRAWDQMGKPNRTDNLSILEFTMTGQTRQKLRYRWLVPAAVVCLAAVASFGGTVAGVKYAQRNAVTLPLSLRADTAAKGKSLSMATGLVSPGVEGLYVLDHATGLLQCWILNPRNGAVGGIYQANVTTEFGADRVGAGDYTLVTGGITFTGGVTGNMAPANSIVYVADEASGNIVGYSFAFNRNMLNRGVMQNGTLNVVCKGTTRSVQAVERDQ